MVKDGPKGITALQNVQALLLNYGNRNDTPGRGLYPYDALKLSLGNVQESKIALLAQCSNESYGAVLTATLFEVSGIAGILRDLDEAFEFLASSTGRITSDLAEVLGMLRRRRK